MSAPASNTPTADASKEASSTVPKQQQEEEKKGLPQLGALEEDDEFEEFAQQGAFPFLYFFCGRIWWEKMSLHCFWAWEKQRSTRKGERAETKGGNRTPPTIKLAQLSLPSLLLPSSLPSLRTTSQLINISRIRSHSC